MSEDTTTTSATTPAVWVTLQARDARRLIDHYVGAFGFALTAEHADGETVHHAELRWPEGAGGLMLGSHDPDRAWSPEPGTAGVYVVVTDVDALHERILARGGEILSPPADTDYGSRELVTRDPEGNLWSFGTYPGAPLPS